jgi:DNA-directed RNA polymerase specialized sigma24 family protein
VDPHPSERQLLDAALAELARSSPGSPSGPAVRRLVDALTPAIQSRVVRTFLRFGGWRVHAALPERTRDQVQTVWAKLFEHEARVLRAWDEQGGLTLASWVGRFAALRTRDAIRDLGRQPWTEGQLPPDELGLRAPAGSPEDLEATRQLWHQAREIVVAEHSELGRNMFELLIEQDASTDEVQQRANMSANSVQQWRSRLRAALRRALDAVSGAPSGGV